jgi:DNA repair photolyase
MKDSKAMKTGTREWSQSSENCCLGCSHGCLYCYARADALRWKRIASPAEWTRERNLPLPKHFKRRPGVVMFPTTHDITPANLDHCLAMLEGLLKAGNRVLVVSKPHASCVAEICRRFGGMWKEIGGCMERLEFRFTIGAWSNSTLAYWEPGAPDFSERWGALRMAFDLGQHTSVSMEPLLTETIWIGKANHLRLRSAWMFTPEMPDERLRALHAEIERIEAGQTEEAVRRVYEALKDNPKVRWKDSYRRVLGLAAEGAA